MEMNQDLSDGSVCLSMLGRDDWPAFEILTLRCRDWLSTFQPDDTLKQYFGDQAAFEMRCQTFFRDAGFGSAYCYGIFLPTENNPRGQLCGEITLSNVRRSGFSSAILGYWVDKDRQGLGIATNAARLACAHAYGALGLHRVEAAIMPENSASLRVIEKTGFRFEGTARGYLRVGGVYTDHRIFARLSTD